MQRYGGMDRAGRGELLEIINTAIAQGINFFDVTGDGERELFGSLLKEANARDKVFISCWMPQEKTLTVAGAKAEAEHALSLLGVEYVDLFYAVWTGTSEQLESMINLRYEGLTKFIGAFGREAALESDLEELDIVVVRHNFYLQYQETSIKQLRTTYPHIGVIAVEPLGKGRFALDKAPAGVSMVGACLKYVLSFQAIDTVLVAVRRLGHLLENIEVWKGQTELTDAERAALEAGRGYKIEI